MIAQCKESWNRTDPTGLRSPPICQLNRHRGSCFSQYRRRLLRSAYSTFYFRFCPYCGIVGATNMFRGLGNAVVRTVSLGHQGVSPVTSSHSTEGAMYTLGEATGNAEESLGSAALAASNPKKVAVLCFAIMSMLASGETNPVSGSAGIPAPKSEQIDVPRAPEQRSEQCADDG